MSAVIGVDVAQIHFLSTRGGNGTHHRVIYFGAAQKTGPARNPAEQAGLNLLQQAGSQAVAGIVPPLAAGGVAGTAWHLGQASVPVTVVGPAVAWGLGAIGVVIACSVGEEARANPGHVVHLVVVEIGAAHEQFGACRAVAVVGEVGHFLRENRVGDASGVDLHAHLPQVSTTGNCGH